VRLLQLSESGLSDFEIDQNLELLHGDEKWLFYPVALQSPFAKNSVRTA